MLEVELVHVNYSKEESSHEDEVQLNVSIADERDN